MLKKQQSCYYSQHKIVETEEAMLIFGRKITPNIREILPNF